MTDSDFSGGGTDGKGHVIDFSYEMENNANIGFDLFINQYGNAVFGREIDYSRLHLFVSQSF